MTDPATPEQTSLPLHVVEESALETFMGGLAPAHRAWAEASRFTGALGQVLVLPDASGRPEAAAVGYGSVASRARGRFHLAAAATTLPEADWRLEGLADRRAIEEEALGWRLASYRFDRYKAAKPPRARLLTPPSVDGARLDAIAAGESLTRDLINTPASDMGPEDLEAAVGTLATRHGASVEVTVGDDLQAANFPMIHAVGRASPRAPRLIDLRWGSDGPTLTLVGKGVCFDTGGLNIKTGGFMSLMKKDMGGAATVLGLASMIMALGLKLRLRVLIPAVENVIAGNALKPKDILKSRKGLTVEVNDTDAEGRLVLADALALADEEKPDLIVSMATLTGAARVAVGPDLAPFYSDDEPLAAALSAAGARVADPVWRLPFWAPYDSVIEPDIADLDNAPGFGFAGSITAALFLRRFVTACPRYAHFDIYGWQPTAAPARPKGGVGQGARALLDALPGVLGL
ncbi:leucyl aminopeptidase family protein [Frigidibacter sp. RF13]|uniref:leucyl aminopeptidase family protein n=1 Tax=Frigidibacter sp. RF13 TaxID=2997340 RepID=UPI00227188AD|nr:leucyl aminopeptidase family protein [Frigidibacter sp. RF13]MCY1128129.1 leucyl aminopeptidase family protein [Frigidibacter sp. RF13]